MGQNKSKSKRMRNGNGIEPSQNDEMDIELEYDPSDDISEHFTITKKILGRGNFSTVKVGIENRTQRYVAIKIISKDNVHVGMLQNEIDILTTVDHENIIHLIATFDGQNEYYLVMEMVTGGELFDAIIEREKFTEYHTQQIMRQLFSAIEYLHNLGIAHRDLKPENLLLRDKSPDSPIKIADFGLSRIYSPNTFVLSTACGTPGYVAPEIIEAEGYDQAVDSWSAGVVMYILLCGYPPFYDNDERILFEKIRRIIYEFHDKFWRDISPEAKDLIQNLLTNQRNRYTPTEALAHPWFRLDLLSQSEKNSNHTVQDKLREHNSIRRESSTLDKAQERYETFAED
eukprot:TRINITY_DN1378_c0_g1_i2.p1 TRINITY_DN1378_c0_g1~~TRINITY_DN1378_c0_g1_i2.p1  ORF type:complete len:343 (-),score=64.66 TRINITY_DN1378_c0_g1_i2:111-1139(-)